MKEKVKRNVCLPVWERSLLVREAPWWVQRHRMYSRVEKPQVYIFGGAAVAEYPKKSFKGNMLQTELICVPLRRTQIQGFLPSSHPNELK